MKLGGSLYESGRLRRKWTTKGGARGTPGTQDIRRRRARSGRDGGNSDGGGGGSAAQRADGGAAAHIGADQAGGEELGGRCKVQIFRGQQTKSPTVRLAGLRCWLICAA
jgi:hypothetical protein